MGCALYVECAAFVFSRMECFVSTVWFEQCAQDAIHCVVTRTA